MVEIVYKNLIVEFPPVCFTSLFPGSFFKNKFNTQLLICDQYKLLFSKILNSLKVPFRAGILGSKDNL